MQSTVILPPVSLRLYGCCKFPEWEQKLCSKWIKLWNDQWTKRSNYLTGGKQEPLSLWLVFYQAYLELCVCVCVCVCAGVRIPGFMTITCVRAQSLQSCLTLCDPLDHGPPGSSVHGILQARVLEWVAISFSSHKVWSEWSEVTQSCPTECNPKNCSLPGSPVHGIFQATVLEWVAISFSHGSHTLWQIVGRKNVADTLLPSLHVYIHVLEVW